MSEEQKFQKICPDDAKKLRIFSKMYQCVSPFREPKFMEWEHGDFAVKKEISTAKFGWNLDALSPPPTIVSVTIGELFIATIITPCWDCPLGKYGETISKQKESYTMFSGTDGMQSAGAFPEKYNHYRAKFSSAALKDFDTIVNSFS